MKCHWGMRQSAPLQAQMKTQFNTQRMTSVEDSNGSGGVNGSPLTDWLKCWGPQGLKAWRTEWLTGWLAGWMTGWLTGQLTESSRAWLYPPLQRLHAEWESSELERWKVTPTCPLVIDTTLAFRTRYFAESRSSIRVSGGKDCRTNSRSLTKNSIWYNWKILSSWKGKRKNQIHG